MLSTVRRGHVLARTVRTCRPLTIESVRVAQNPLISSKQAVKAATVPRRPFHVFSSLKSTAAAAATEAQPEEKFQQEPITKFSELSDRHLVDKKVVQHITKGMGLSTMTEVQSLTINETLKGVDVYGFLSVIVLPRQTIYIYYYSRYP